MTMPIAAAASGNPCTLMPATQSGEKTTPPMLAPLYAMDSAAGRVRTNHGETIALTAVAPIAAQPAPLVTSPRPLHMLETSGWQCAFALGEAAHWQENCASFCGNRNAETSLER